MMRNTRYVRPRPNRGNASSAIATASGITQSRAFHGMKISGMSRGST